MSQMEPTPFPLELQGPYQLFRPPGMDRFLAADQPFFLLFS